MGNLDITQRNSLERSTAGRQRRPAPRNREGRGRLRGDRPDHRGRALRYAAIETINSGWQWLVLGMIVVTLIGAMIALSPNRRALDRAGTAGTS